jgi:hypothetical protein
VLGENDLAERYSGGFDNLPGGFKEVDVGYSILKERFALDANGRKIIVFCEANRTFDHFDP